MPVVVIAESGATKTEWRMFDQKRLISSFRTIGLNPTTHAPRDFEQHLTSIFQQHIYPHSIEEILFYGAGLKDSAQKQQLFTLLHSHAPTSRILVEDDLQAAVYATGKPSGIICILGTGSNASKFEQSKIVERRGGHGYLLGDEGSGVDLGKTILKALLQRDFSMGVHQEWIHILEKEPEVLRGEIYQAARPQIALGEITQNIPEMLKHPEVEQLILGRFDVFLSTTVCRFSDFERYPIDFVGSVAIYFQPLLQKSLDHRGLSLGKIIEHPIEELVKYYIDL